jgi:hypothetical protein
LTYNLNPEQLSQKNDNRAELNGNALSIHFAKKYLTFLPVCDRLLGSIVFNPQIAALHLCSQRSSQPTAIFIFGAAKFARSELVIHCEHPGEPQINTCGFVFSSSFSNNQSSTSENTDDLIQ